MASPRGEVVRLSSWLKNTIGMVTLDLSLLFNDITYSMPKDSRSQPGRESLKVSLSAEEKQKKSLESYLMTTNPTGGPFLRSCINTYRIITRLGERNCCYIY